jgi:hypothetical protein
MQKTITTCDICDKPYDPAKESDEPFHRVALSDPPPMEPHEEMRLDAELKLISKEIKKEETTPQAKVYYAERIEALKKEAGKRRSVAPEARLDADVICHVCWQKLREFVRQLKGS